MAEVCELSKAEEAAREKAQGGRHPRLSSTQSVHLRHTIISACPSPMPDKVVHGASARSKGELRILRLENEDFRTSPATT